MRQTKLKQNLTLLLFSLMVKFKIPFTFPDLKKQKIRSEFFIQKISYRKKSTLGEELKNCDVPLTREEYLGICLRCFVMNFIILFVISTTILAMVNADFFVVYGFGIAVIFSGFVFFSQRVYPYIYVSRKQMEIEKNLVLALEDILIQLNSGIPLFEIMTNISESDYCMLSFEFKKAVKMISSGQPESDVLDYLGKKNPSVFFRRVLWLISNGMRSGSDMSIVIKESVKTLNEEQLIQIQNYGNRLNPLIVFYMLIAVIIPALSITFLTIISSMVNLPQNMIVLLFIGLFVFDVLIQVMFLGLIKSRRPSLF